MTPDERISQLEARFERHDDRLRENERVTAMQGLTLTILTDETKKHADRETVNALDALTRGQIVPDVAILKAQMSESQQGRAAGIIRAATGALKAALAGNVKALGVIAVFATPIILAVVVLILALTGQLDETLAALRGTPETTVQAPEATINAPDATIRP